MRVPDDYLKAYWLLGKCALASAWEGLQTGRPTSRRCHESTRSQHDVRVDVRSDESLDTLAEARIPLRLAGYLVIDLDVKWRPAV